MAKQRKDVTEQLAELQQRVASAGVGQREAQAELQSINGTLEQFRERRVDAFAAGDDERGDALTAEVEQLGARLAQASARAEGLGRRASTARAELSSFRSDNAEALLAAHEPAAQEITAKLTASVAETIRLARQYVAERQAVDQLVAATPGATPRSDGPASEHAWEAALKALERAYQRTPEVAAPLPRWAGIGQRKQQDAVARREQLRRKPRRTDQDQAEIDRINLEVGGVNPTKVEVA